MKSPLKFAALVCCLGFSITSWARPMVVTSIHPLSLIASAIIGDTAQTHQLLPASEEPHHYSLRIGDKLALQKADLVVWVGPGLEGFLARAISDLNPAKVLTASTLSDIQPRDSQDKPEHDKDLHLWLNPDYAVVIATELANWLAARHPQQAPGLLTRLEHFRTSTRDTSKAITTELEALQGKRILVDHDAFGHFFAYFGIEQAGALKSTTGLAKGARELASTLNDGNFDCIVAEPRSHHSRVQRVAAQSTAPTVVIDPLGAHLSPAENSYSEFLHGIAQSLLSCQSDTSALHAH